MGSFDNTVKINYPNNIIFKNGNGEILNKIEVDACLANEIKKLLSKGIKTLASCCGHNVYDPTIIVAKNNISTMSKLGYKHWENPTDKTRKDGFYAKSVKRIRYK